MFYLSGNIKNTNCSHFTGLILERYNFHTVRNVSNPGWFNGYKFIGDSKYFKPVKF